MKQLIIILLVIANIISWGYIIGKEIIQRSLCTMANQGILSQATMREVNIDSFCERT